MREKIIYEISPLGKYSSDWKKGLCVDNYLELMHIDTDTLYFHICIPFFLKLVWIVHLSLDCAVAYSHECALFWHFEKFRKCMPATIIERTL